MSDNQGGLFQLDTLDADHSILIDHHAIQLLRFMYVVDSIHIRVQDRWKKKSNQKRKEGPKWLTLA